MEKLIVLVLLPFLFSFISENNNSNIKGLFVSNSLQATRTVSGVVSDKENNKPLKKVAVVQQGTLNGTLTNENGEYEITVPADSVVLIFSHVGYQVAAIGVPSGYNGLDVSLARSQQPASLLY